MASSESAASRGRGECQLGLLNRSHGFVPRSAPIWRGRVVASTVPAGGPRGQSQTGPDRAPCRRPARVPQARRRGTWPGGASGRASGASATPTPPRQPRRHGPSAAPRRGGRGGRGPQQSARGGRPGRPQRQTRTTSSARTPSPLRPSGGTGRWPSEVLCTGRRAASAASWARAIRDRREPVSRVRVDVVPVPGGSHEDYPVLRQTRGRFSAPVRVSVCVCVASPRGVRCPKARAATGLFATGVTVSPGKREFLIYRTHGVSPSRRRAAAPGCSLPAPSRTCARVSASQDAPLAARAGPEAGPHVVAVLQQVGRLAL